MANNYESFKGQILQLTKIDLNAYKERQMKRRIDALISKHNITNYDEYVMAIRRDGKLFEEFVNYLTINVSEFYRNPEQWTLLEKEIFPWLFNRFGQNLKIWSAACSTGDEPYSLVMLLSRFLPLNRIRIIATDIDRQVLSSAQLGLYNERSLKGLPKEFLHQFFTKIDERNYQISSSVKSCVEFKRHNLLAEDYPRDCDLIVCRNVLIYFTEEAKDAIYRKFYGALKKDGILFVGSTEQIIKPLDIGLKPIKSFYYQKQ